VEGAAIRAGRKGQRHYASSGRKTTYGAIAPRAAQTALPDLSKIRIKGPDQFTLIGTEQKNLDVPLKVTGKAVYGIDVVLPGMLYAAAKPVRCLEARSEALTSTPSKTVLASTRL